VISAVVLATALAACASLPGAPPRAATSPLACIRTTVASKVPTEGDDKLRHCLAAGLIARHCSPGEAWLASWGKEAQDVLGPGDADRRDLDADRAGRRCARGAADDAALQACCASAYSDR
jgi:hypothetical protein